MATGLISPVCPLQALGVLGRARRLGIAPNTVMYNTAMSALAKSGRAAAAEELFAQIPEPDAVSYEVQLLSSSSCPALQECPSNPRMSLCFSLYVLVPYVPSS